MTGGDGNDTYMVDSASDRVIEAGTAGSGVDTIVSSINYTLAAKGLNYFENLTLTGTAISATGNGLDNVLTGNAQNNVLNGGLGSDTLTGGLGADEFVFNTAASLSNIDTITDFDVLVDHIQLENAIFKTIGGVGALALNQFVAGAGAVATSATEHVIYDSTTGALYYDSNGVTAGGMIQIANLGAGLALTHDAFMVI